MKILFYVEPHPIRNELTHHRNILLSKWGRKILQWNENDQFGNHEVRIACHQFAYQDVQNQIPDLMPFVIPTNTTEEAVIQNNLILWGSGGIDLWCKLMKGEKDRRLNVYKEFIDRIKKEQFDFDVVVFWGLNGFVANHVKSLQAVPLFMELASIRPPFPPSVYIDSDGVNGFASPRELTINYMKEKLNGMKGAKSLLEGSTSNPLSEKKVFDSKFEFTSVNFTSSADEKDCKKVLVPLQIGDDSNILLGSDYENAFEFVEDTIKIFKDSDFSLVFKPHPGAKGRGGVVFEDHYRAHRLVESSDNCIWYEENVTKDDYVSFLRQFDAIVTINSSLGFEGMLLGVPVFPLGEAIYKPDDYKFDKKQLPSLIDKQYYKFISDGYIISDFIINFVFFREQTVADSFDVFVERVKIYVKSYESEKEMLYNDLVNSYSE